VINRARAQPSSKITLAALEQAPPTMNTRKKLMRDLQKLARLTPNTFSAEAACMCP